MARKRNRRNSEGAETHGPSTVSECLKTLEKRVIAAEERAAAVEEGIAEVKAEARAGLDETRAGLDETKAGLAEVKEGVNGVNTGLAEVNANMHSMQEILKGAMGILTGSEGGNVKPNVGLSDGSSCGSEGDLDPVDTKSNISGVSGVGDELSDSEIITVKVAETCPAEVGAPLAQPLDPTEVLKLPPKPVKSLMKPKVMKPVVTPVITGRTTRVGKPLIKPPNPVLDSVVSNRSGNFWPAAGHRSSMKLETFDGKNMSFIDYLHHFEAVRACNNWDDETAGASFAASLRGPALTLLTELPNGHWQDLSVMVPHLEKRYNRQSRDTHLRTEFSLRKKLPNESPAEFAGALGALARQAFAGVDPYIQDDFIRQQFVTGFPSVDLCKHLALSRAESIDELVIVANTYNSIVNAHKGQQSTLSAPKPVVAAVRNDSPSPESQSSGIQQILVFCEKLDAGIARILEVLETMNGQRKKNSNGNSRRKPIRCHNCGESQHLAKECPKSLCTKCNELGHMYVNCPTTTPSEVATSSNTKKTPLNSN